MEIKVTGKTKEDLEENVSRVLNIVTVICNGGYLPNDIERLTPEQNGKWWFRDGDKYNLEPRSNDYKMFIRKESDTEIVLEFNYRYGNGRGYNESISSLLAAWLDCVILIKN